MPVDPHALDLWRERTDEVGLGSSAEPDPSGLHHDELALEAIPDLFDESDRRVGERRTR